MITFEEAPPVGDMGGSGESIAASSSRRIRIVSYVASRQNVRITLSLYLGRMTHCSGIRQIIKRFAGDVIQIKHRKKGDTTMAGTRGPKGTPNGGLRGLVIDGPVPSPPDYLDGDALDKFKEIIALADRHGFIGYFTEFDLTILVEFCMVHSEIRMMEKFVREHGFSFQAVNGNYLPRPETRILHGLRQRLESLAKQLGLTPWSRNAIAIPDKDEDDELEKFEKEHSGGN